MVSRLLLVAILPLCIFQDERVSFDKPGETKRQDRESFKKEDRMKRL